ncbi:MAG: ABC transporter permease [Cyclobacteriaceae bacterium]
MFKNFIVLAYRHFIRSPLSSFIELFGMTAGLTVFLLVLLWVFHETSFDEFNEKKDRIYRVEWSSPANPLMGISHSTIAPILEENMPEVEKIVRFYRRKSAHDIYRLNGQNEKEYIAAGSELYADVDFFDLFSFEFIAGVPSTALAEKNTVVLTESLAKTIFGDISVIGQHLFDEENHTLTVTGVIKDRNDFHIPFKMLRSFISIKDIQFSLPKSEDPTYTWHAFDFPTYLLFNSTQNLSALEKKMTAIVESNRPEREKTTLPGIKLQLTALRDIYFNGGNAVERGYSKHGDSKKLIAYSSIAIFTLLLACVNFVNLNSAKSLERAKEVGIKKVSGASRSNVFIQFFGEILTLCLISLVLALIFTHSILPWFNGLMNTSLSTGSLLDPWVFTAMIMGLVLISLASGGLPAFYMSSFQPVVVMKGINRSNKSGFRLKKVSLVLQFIITTILLIGTITIFHQINYMKNADLGFASEHSVVFEFGGAGFGQEADILKMKLQENSNILGVSYTSAVPGRNTAPDDYQMQIISEGKEYNLTRTTIDKDYLKVLNIDLVEGRNFDKNRFLDKYHIGQTNPNNIYRVLLNETAVKTIGLADPIGAKLKHSRLARNFEVIGVVKDFHLNSLDNPIIPMYFSWFAGRNDQIVAKISSVDMASTLQFIESEVEKITSTMPHISFLDDEFNRQYQSDDNFAELIGYFAALAILIACMGLLGIATHAIKLRIKEVGIRKIMGASALQILGILMGSFLVNVVISAIIAIPIGWLIMDHWLTNYAYHIDLNWWIFALACGLTVFIATATIIWQSWRASSVNPARLIRYE